MAYKSKTVTVNNWATLNEELRDFLVTDVGWTDESPSGQDDEMGAGNYHGVLGTFLRSAGEDGNQDVRLHLHGIQADVQSLTSPQYKGTDTPAFSYLASGVGVGDGSATVADDTELAAIATPFVIRMNDELAVVSNVAANVLTLSIRGAYGTSAATHVAGDVVLNLTYAQPLIMPYAFRDITTALLSSSGTASISADSVTSMPGLSGYGDDRFNHHAFFKITDGAEAGKMRPIKNYASAGGDFDFSAFQKAPGTANADIVSMGFLPARSARIGEGTTYFNSPRIAIANAGTDTVCWFYACKDNVWVITKLDGGYSFFFAGNVIPYAARDTTTTVGTSTAGTTSVVVANRNLFVEGEKYRIISQDADDWAVNEATTGTEPDLDPEEIPTEEVVVQSITPGAGDTGTLTLNANLLFTYNAGAVIGEDPRPAICQISNYNGIYPAAANELIQGIDCWLPVYMPCEKTALSSHASHRQTSRAVHNSGDPETPSPSYLSSRGRGAASPFLGVAGETTPGSHDANFFSRQNGRPTMGLVSVYNDETSSTAYGVFPTMKGALPQCWWIELDTADVRPYSAADEDTYKARWGSAYEEFRIFTQRGDATDTAIFGPEIA